MCITITRIDRVRISVAEHMARLINVNQFVSVETLDSGAIEVVVVCMRINNLKQKHMRIEYFFPSSTL